jgi:hypothetical protein
MKGNCVQSMRQFLTASGWFVSLFATGEALGQNQLHVSTFGDDRWSGLLSTANASKTDGPKRTLVGARDAIRALKRNNQLSNRGAIVNVQSGIYAITTTFDLNGEDAGAPGAPIIYKSVVPKGAQITGPRIRQWQPVTEPYRSRLDPSVRSKVVMTDLRMVGMNNMGEFPVRHWSGNSNAMPPTVPELFLNDRRMTLARWPNTGYTTVSSVTSPTVLRTNLSTSRLTAQDNNVWLYGYPSAWDWAFLGQPTTINLSNGDITVANGGITHAVGGRFILNNALSFLDSPGEYWVDRANRKLLFYPPQDLRSAAVTVTAGDRSLISIRFTSHIEFQGFTVEHARGDAMLVEACNNVVVRGLTVRNTGGFGVKVLNGSSNTVASCTMYNIGETAIGLTGGDRATLVPGNHLATNNRLSKFGQLAWAYRPGIHMNGVGNVASHNEITDAPHSAILAYGNNQLVEKNIIENVILDTNDAGAIYMAGTDSTWRGLVIKDNVFRDIRTFVRKPVAGNQCWAIYLDNRGSGVTIDGNVFERVECAVNVNGGRDNKFVNNVIADSDCGMQIEDRSHVSWPSLQTSFDAMRANQAPYSSAYPSLSRIFSEDPLLPAHNQVEKNALLRNTRNLYLRSQQMRLTDNATSRLDILYRHVVSGTGGLFVNELLGDYTPLPGTQLANANFRALRTSNAGVRTDAFIRGRSNGP